MTTKLEWYVRISVYGLSIWMDKPYGVISVAVLILVGLELGWPRLG